MINRISGLLRGGRRLRCVHECDGRCVFVESLLLFFAPPPRSHPPSQPLPVSMGKIDVQSLLDPLPHLVIVLAPTTPSVSPTARGGKTVKDEVISQTPPLPLPKVCLFSVSSQSQWWKRLHVNLHEERGLKKERGSIHYQVMESDERRRVK